MLKDHATFTLKISCVRWICFDCVFVIIYLLVKRLEFFRSAKFKSAKFKRELREGNLLKNKILNLTLIFHFCFLLAMSVKKWCLFVEKKSLFKFTGYFKFQNVQKVCSDRSIYTHCGLSQKPSPEASPL